MEKPTIIGRGLLFTVLSQLINKKKNERKKKKEKYDPLLTMKTGMEVRKTIYETLYP